MVSRWGPTSRRIIVNLLQTSFFARDGEGQPSARPTDKGPPKSPFDNFGIATPSPALGMPPAVRLDRPTNPRSGLPQPMHHRQWHMSVVKETNDYSTNPDVFLWIHNFSDKAISFDDLRGLCTSFFGLPALCGTLPCPSLGPSCTYMALRCIAGQALKFHVHVGATFWMLGSRKFVHVEPNGRGP